MTGAIGPSHVAQQVTVETRVDGERRLEAAGTADDPQGTELRRIEVLAAVLTRQVGQQLSDRLERLQGAVFTRWPVQAEALLQVQSLLLFLFRLFNRFSYRLD